MRLLNTIVVICLLQQVTGQGNMEATGGLSNKVLHALPEFVSGEMLAALKNSVSNQFDRDAVQQRCIPSSCVLPHAEVTAVVGGKLRQALASVDSTQTMDMSIPLVTQEGANVSLPALRTELDGQGKADFHDDFDVDEPQNEATWTALLYLEASHGDRFKVRLRDNPQHVESRDIAPGTLILFKSSEVEHTATGTTEGSRRLALGPVALNNQASQHSDVKASTTSFRARILSWGSSSSSSKNSSGSRSNVDMSHHYLWIAGFVALWMIRHNAS